MGVVTKQRPNAASHAMTAALQHYDASAQWRPAEYAAHSTLRWVG